MLLALAGLVAVWACSEDAETPLQPDLDVPVQMSVDDDQVPAGFTPNGVPYRNPGYKNATGRSGEATLTARALINMDGTTDVEVTTGDFEGTAPPFDMTKLQTKLLDPDGETVWTDNQNHIETGFHHTVYDDVVRHDDLQLQANVEVPNASGKKSRNGVVTIQERANLRPDLAAQSVAGPAEVFINTTAAFVATIEELNGDLSATANCVFYVDGDEAARSDGIWVGEGDQVTCFMSHFFDAAGSHTVEVAVEDVSPGDWDLSNNTASTTIDVAYELNGYAWAQDRRSNERYTRYYYSSYNYRRIVTANNSIYDTDARFYGVTQGGLAFPTSLSVTQSSGGITHDAVNLSSFGYAGTGCRYWWTGKSSIQVCTNGSYTWVNVVRNSGRATYYTREVRQRRYCGWWSCYWRTVGVSYYTNNSQWGGGYQALATDYTFDVRLVDNAGFIFTQDPVVIPLPSWYSFWRSYIYGGYIDQWTKAGSTSF